MESCEGIGGKKIIIIIKLLPDTARGAGPYNERQNGSSSRVSEEGATQVGYPDSGRWTWILNLSSFRSGM